MEQSHLNLLKKHFNFSILTEDQFQIYQQLLGKQNSLAILPTGAGKSLCYQFTALLFEGTSIIVSPLLSLMKDQVDTLTKQNIPAFQIDSSTPLKELSASVLQQYKLIYLAPEQLEKNFLFSQLIQLDISIFAIDEAHCFSEWGHSFRPDYLKLPKAIRRLKPEVVLAVTATATRKVEQNLRNSFKIKKDHCLRRSSKRTNLRFQITPCLQKEKFDHLCNRLHEYQDASILIYVTKQETSEALSSQLNQHGFFSRAYNAGMHSDARRKTLDLFLQDQCRIVVATIAFGMGIDKKNVRCVIHYDMPKSPEGWLQEAGRAGRDGALSLCEVLACANDQIVLENFIHAHSFSKRKLEQLLSLFLRQDKLFPVSLYDLSIQFDLQQQQLKSFITDLEIGGYIKHVDTGFRRARITSKSKNCLQDLSRKDRFIAEILLEQTQYIDLLTLSENNGWQLLKVCKLLDSLQNQGSITFTPSNRILFFKTTSKQFDFVSISASLIQNFQTRHNFELHRIEQVTKILLSKSCIPNNMARYLGEPKSLNCGECSACKGEHRKRTLPFSPIEKITSDEQERIQNLIRSNATGLRSVEALTRFCAGVFSPIIFRKRLYQHKDFGMWKRLPIREISIEIQALFNRQL